LRGLDPDHGSRKWLHEAHISVQGFR
jgi:hypothetical protein